MRTGATVCAEGVEIPAELTALQQLGVDLAQGWLIARPTPHWTNTPLLADHAHAA